jgi:hypothetical protein
MNRSLGPNHAEINVLNDLQKDINLPYTNVQPHPQYPFP